MTGADHLAGQFVPGSGGRRLGVTLIAEKGEKMTARSTRGPHPNILLFGIDSLGADHTSCYGYHRQTTPRIDRFAEKGTLFERTYSSFIPATSAYACMLTGADVFSTQVVASKHKGPLTATVTTLAEVLKEVGYNTTCVGLTGSPSSRGFDTYLDYDGQGVSGDGRAHKARKLNEVTIPELDRLASARQPFLLFLRHMDPHAPYLPPEPFERMFYHGNERDSKNKSMAPVWAFEPFHDYYASWIPEDVTDKDYVIAQHDGAVSYVDACIQTIFTALEARDVLSRTIVVITAGHGETLYEHECWFDHHGLYDANLHVPLIIRYPRNVPAGRRVGGYTQLQDLVPTLLDLADIETDGVHFDGESLMPMVRGEVVSHRSEFYITECGWMRKHGWRTPEWKLIEAVEPDFHFKPLVELYNLVEDPGENTNLAETSPDVVTLLKGRMEEWIGKREQETGRTNPLLTQDDWHGYEGVGHFITARQAYDTLRIGGVVQAEAGEEVGVVEKSAGDESADERPVTKRKSKSKKKPKKKPKKKRAG